MATIEAKITFKALSRTLTGNSLFLAESFGSVSSLDYKTSISRRRHHIYRYQTYRNVVEEVFNVGQVVADEGVHHGHERFFSAKSHAIGQVLQDLRDQRQCPLSIVFGPFYRRVSPPLNGVTVTCLPFTSEFSLGTEMAGQYRRKKSIEPIAL